jgi:hypothetical protein
MHEFEVALGQYLLYRRLLALTAPDYELYLAVSSQIHLEFFGRESVQEIVRHYQVALVIVNLEKEEIDQWTS